MSDKINIVSNEIKFQAYYQKFEFRKLKSRGISITGIHFCSKVLNDIIYGNNLYAYTISAGSNLSVNHENIKEGEEILIKEL